MLLHPDLRIPVSNATCLDYYSWMENEEKYDPCLVVAYVIAACVGNSWTQPALPPGYHYDRPSGPTATPCYCSWSCYNLMMACTWCQSTNTTDSLLTWPSFSEGCPSSYSNEYFPAGYVLQSDVSIPYWAATNPTNWSSEIFNVEDAQQYANQGKPDLRPSITPPTSKTHSSDLSTIIGATVGAIAAALLVIAIYLWFKRRKNRPMKSQHQSPLTINSKFPEGSSLGIPQSEIINIREFPSIPTDSGRPIPIVD